MKKFKKSPKKTKTIVISAVAITILIGGIYLYKTYALYEEKKEFNLLKGRIVDFRKNNKDIEISAIVNGKPSEEIPNKESGYIVEEVYCTNNAEGVWDNEEWVLNIKNLSTSKTTCSLNFYPKSFNEFIIAKSVGNEEIEKFEHKETEQTPALTDYRYIGENPKNYVCFGSEENPCPEENLYRIIGVIPTQSEENGRYLNRVKLIKEDFYTENESGNLQISTSTKKGYGYKWGKDFNNNNWEESPLNLEVLNQVYWNHLKEYQNYISKSIWYLGAMDHEKREIYTSNDYYFGERSHTKSLNGGKISFIANIGLLYPSDYGYSIGSQYENSAMFPNKEFYQSNSWLYQLEQEYYEWTISPDYTYRASNAYAIYNRGEVSIQGVDDPRFHHNVRPAFYLKETIGYKSGNGTKANPYRIHTI